MNFYVKFLAALAFALCGVASAHTVLEYPVATAAQSYKATFKVGHGCGTSPTRQIAIDIPMGVKGAKPMPKPGWRLEVTREKLMQPYISHGRSITEDVTRITWTAKSTDDMLPSGYYDEFVLVGTLPSKAGMMYWPVQQVCEQGRNDWTEVPQPGQKLSDLQSPAAALEIMPSAGVAAHVH
ncbi:YcnI family protein [Limnohabitans sp. Rim47]|uniref:YcnI family copper-binding membrane protein n=1 Tax=Limnohabitans sp. Rim47 TaxID=1100721 RepID=UPI00036C1F9F|nr:YcnI family protein [Limnohabitans sp. Rim47]